MKASKVHHHIKKILEFLVYSDCTDALKASLAAAIRHSREQAQRPYDRRTANDRKQLAVSLAREYAKDQFEQDPDDLCADQETERPLWEWLKKTAL